MWKICENHKIVEKFGAEISGLIGRENRCCNQLRSKCKNHGGKWCKMVKNQYKNPCKNRPLSVPFLFRTSGKGTDMATPLRLEKYGRIDFSPGRWTSMGQNASKLVSTHAKDEVEVGWNFFTFTFKAVAVTFLEVIFDLSKKVLNW